MVNNHGRGAMFCESLQSNVKKRFSNVNTQSRKSPILLLSMVSRSDFQDAEYVCTHDLYNPLYLREIQFVAGKHLIVTFGVSVSLCLYISVAQKTKSWKCMAPQGCPCCT